MLEGILDITDYYTRMKRLWEDLNTFHTNDKYSFDYTCGEREHLYKAEQGSKLIQILMRLNEAYTAVRENILMINPLPIISQTISLLV